MTEEQLNIACDRVYKMHLESDSFNYAWSKEDYGDPKVDLKTAKQLMTHKNVLKVVSHSKPTVTTINPDLYGCSTYLEAFNKINEIERAKNTRLQINTRDYTQIAGDGATQSIVHKQDPINNETWIDKILKDIKDNAVQYIIATVIGYIGGLSSCEGYNRSKAQQKTKTDTTKIERMPQK